MASGEDRTYASAVEGPTYSDDVEMRSRVIRPDVPEDVDDERKQFLEDHFSDPNFDLRSKPPSFLSVDEKKNKYDSDGNSVISSRNSSMMGFDDESPYPEVRAAVSTTDDPEMPVNTFRMWTIGIIMCLFSSGFNQIFAMRYPGLFISSIVVQLISLPIGKAFEKLLPTRKFKTFKYIWSLNPGPFNIKEHVCITVIANVSVSGAYSTEIILAQRIFYGQKTPMSYQILLALGTQCIGFCLGGLLRQFVVWPSSMIWPGALVNATLFNTLHKSYGRREGNHMSREMFFLIVLIAAFVWYWVPSFLFVGLSLFNWVCWIRPEDRVINTLFGAMSGLGMSVFTFDWAMMSYFGSPLVTPWWSQANTGASFVIIFWIIAPIIYFTNTWDAAYFPISSYYSFDNTGNYYNISAILTDGLFDSAKYEAYSRLFMSTTLALSYGAAFAAFPAVFVHTFLWFRKDIMRRFRTKAKDEHDIHLRLMSVYPEVPAWWYLAVGAVAFVFICVSISIYPTHLPIWAAIIGLLLATALTLPLAMLQAITNQTIPTQILSQLIAGYMIPGRPVANMIFKTIGFITTNQAIFFAGDLKLGHYMKIPPRMMFTVQVFPTVIACCWVLNVQEWMFNNIPDMCTPGQKNGFICPGSTSFATASIIWGGIGPRRLFSPGAPYSALLYFFLIGAILPFPFYFLARRYPLSIWRYIAIPVCFAGLGSIPPATGLNYISWLLVGFVFNFVIRRKAFRWWMRYNYILSAGLDSGTAIAGVIIFFSLYLGTNVSLEWAGNTLPFNTRDAMALGYKDIPEQGFVGGTTWK